MSTFRLCATTALTVTTIAIAADRIGAQGAGAAPLSQMGPLSPKAVAEASAQFAKGKTPGQEVFNRNCAACHANGVKFPGTVALNAKYGGTLPGALEDRKDLTPDIVRYFVRNGVSIMPGWRKSQITDRELDDLAKYLSKKR